MRYNEAELTDTQRAALQAVAQWKPSYFDVLLKDDRGHPTPAATGVRMRLTQLDGHLRPIHLMQELISDSDAFAQAVVQADAYRAHVEAKPREMLAALVEQEHQSLEAALGARDAVGEAEASMHIRVLNAAVKEQAAGIHPAAIAAAREQNAAQGQTR